MAKLSGIKAFLAQEGHYTRHRALSTLVGTAEAVDRVELNLAERRVDIWATHPVGVAVPGLFVYGYGASEGPCGGTDVAASGQLALSDVLACSYPARGLSYPQDSPSAGSMGRAGLALDPPVRAVDH